MKYAFVYPLLFIVLTSRSQLPIPANLTPFAARPTLGDETETFLNNLTFRDLDEFFKAKPKNKTIERFIFIVRSR
jgi:hypothetical protein